MVDIAVKTPGFRLTGSAGADTMRGSGMRDVLSGAGGDDLLLGDRGVDVLDGGLGNDRLLGEAGEDMLLGGGGADAAEGGAAADRLDGAAGSDLLRGGDDADTLIGGGDADRLYGEEGDGSLNGDDGDDGLSGGAGDDELIGSNGDDMLTDTYGADTLTGGLDDDLLVSRSDSGEPAIASPDAAGQGRTFGDVRMPPSGDVLTGGSDADTFRFEFLINARPRTAAAAAGADGRIDWRAVAAASTRAHDHWVEGIGNDIITDFRAKSGDRIEIVGHDVAVRQIEHRGGDSIIHLWSPAAGRPEAHDGDLLGTITVLGEQITAAQLVVNNSAFLGAYTTVWEGPTTEADLPILAPGLALAGTEEGNTMRGSGFRDTLTGAGGDDLLSGGRGGDRLLGGLGADELLGDAGGDTLEGGEGDDLAEGGTGADLLTGGAGMDMLHGGEDGDTVRGGGDADRICGEEGDDSLDGEAGNDSLWGGDGDDALAGGDGGDTLVDTYGADTLLGGAGNDVLLSRSDDGEPEIAIPDLGQRFTIRLPDGTLYQPKAFGDEQIPPSDDVLTGGAGADVFRFETFINARPEIAEMASDRDGRVDWMTVAMDFNRTHYHWVDGFGNDTVTDYNRAEGDRIELAGHTMTVKSIEYSGQDSIIHLWSITSARRAAHQEDLLGTITVLGARVTEAELVVDKAPFYGAYTYLHEMPYAADDCGVLPYGGMDMMA